MRLLNLWTREEVQRPLYRHNPPQALHYSDRRLITQTKGGCGSFLEESRPPHTLAVSAEKCSVCPCCLVTCSNQGALRKRCGRPPVWALRASCPPQVLGPPPPPLRRHSLRKAGRAPGSGSGGMAHSGRSPPVCRLSLPSLSGHHHSLCLAHFVTPFQTRLSLGLSLFKL